MYWTRVSIRDIYIHRCASIGVIIKMDVTSWGASAVRVWLLLSYLLLPSFLSMPIFGGGKNITDRHIYSHIDIAYEKRGHTNWFYYWIARLSSSSSYQIITFYIKLCFIISFNHILEHIILFLIYPIILLHIISYNPNFVIRFYHIISYHFISFHITSNILSRRIILHHIT